MCENFVLRTSGNNSKKSHMLFVAWWACCGCCVCDGCCGIWLQSRRRAASLIHRLLLMLTARPL